jgi:hypothetical protein
MRLPRLVAAALVVILVASCSSKSGSTARPSSNAQLQIISPTPDEVTGPDVHVVLNLVGGTVVPATQLGGPLRGNEGHIHVSVDGQLVSMAYSTTQDLHGCAPGPHSLQAEFVAIDHFPFSNRVRNSVLFSVKSSGAAPASTIRGCLP